MDTRYLEAMQRTISRGDDAVCRVFVDPTNGSDGMNSGLYVSRAKATLAAALAVGNGTVQFPTSLKSPINNVLTPLRWEIGLLPGTYNIGQLLVAANDTKIIGLASDPGRVIVQEAALIAAGNVLFNVTGLGVTFENFKIPPPTTSTGSNASQSATANVAAVKIYTAATTANGSARTHFKHMVFQGRGANGGTYGSYAAILACCDSTHQQDDGQLEDCVVKYMNVATNGAAILGIEANAQFFSGWKLRRNEFIDNSTDLNAACKSAVIGGRSDSDGNLFGLLPSAGTKIKHIDLSGTGSGFNDVHRSNPTPEDTPSRV